MAGAGEAVGAHEAFAGAPGAMLVIISGPSGVGKDTIIRALRARDPDARRRFVVTWKSRPRRPGEVDGVDYHFVSAERFAELRATGAFLETAEVHGAWSGTPRDQVEAALGEGRDAILKIDVQGAQAIRRLAPDALLIFVAPPSLEVLSGRLEGRNTETDVDRARRLHDAPMELASQVWYDHVVVNETGQVERTAAAIEAIIEAAHAEHPERRVRIARPA